MQNKTYELTLRGILLGGVLTIIFTMSNVYLGLKVGITFSSSIPAVVIAMAFFGMFKNSNILENNMVQTQVSAAGTLSAIIFVIPALFMVGYWNEFPLWLTFMVSLCGGILGVLFTIPLRKAMVVESKLVYPEGRAAAEILKLSNKDKNKLGLKEMLFGGFLSSIFSLLSNAFKILPSEGGFSFIFNKMIFSVSAGYSLALFGAGYLVGIVGAVALFIGVFLAWGVFVPYFSYGLNADMNLANTIWSSKVKFIGIGIIAIASLWTLMELMKPVISGMKNMFNDVKYEELDQRSNDLSFKNIFLCLIVVMIGLFVTFYSFVSYENLSFFHKILFSFAGTLVAGIIGFFVSSACGYMAGLVGSSSSPISGIGIIAIIISSLVAMFLGIQIDIFENEIFSKFLIAFAIFIASVVLSTAAIANDNLQDLKTGHMVGATPWKQQIALIIGCIFGSLAIAPVLNLLYQAYGFIGAMPREGMDEKLALAAPQANLMNNIASGILKQDINWQYIMLGVGIGIFFIIIDNIIRKTRKNLQLPTLAIGVGVYLPPIVSLPLVFGGIVSYLVKKYISKKHEKSDFEKICEQKGILFASGLIVGESLFGVIIAGITVFSISNGGSASPLDLGIRLDGANFISIILFILIVLFFIRKVVRN